MSTYTTKEELREASLSNLAQSTNFVSFLRMEKRKQVICQRTEDYFASFLSVKKYFFSLFTYLSEHEIFVSLFSGHGIFFASLLSTKKF